MKAWFIFMLGNEKVGVYTNSAENGEKLLRKTYGDDTKIEFVDIDMFGEQQPYRKLRIGMSSCDCLIASGMIGYFSEVIARRQL